MILNEIADRTRKRVRLQKRLLSPHVLRERAEKMDPETGFPFERALRTPGMSFLCEVKKASPSKGVIAEDFPYLEIAKDYEAAGAAAISVLTEPDYFQGSDRYLKEIAKAVKLPVLRKDFVVDAYQIYEAKTLGASAVLLICAILDARTLRAYLALSKRLGLSALVEAHSEREVRMALAAGATVVGVNNRDLRDFTVSLETGERLARLIPPEVLFVAESGIRTAEDVKRMEAAGAGAVLVGETLMRAPDKKAALDSLRGTAEGGR